MKKSKVLILSLMISILALSTACASKDAAKLNMGKVDGSKYTNKYFGFSVEVPKNWTVLEEKIKDEVNNRGKETKDGTVAGDNTQNDLSKEVTLNLFSATMRPVGDTKYEYDQFNPNFALIAENLSLNSDVKSSNDYLLKIKKRLGNLVQIPYKFKKGNYPKKIGGELFDVMEVKIESATVVITQNYYARKVNGYILCFVATYSSDIGQKELDGIVNTVKMTK